MNEHRLPTGPTYDEDFYAWTQHQARLLHDLSKRREAAPANLDLPHLAEEIGDLGKAELRGVTSLIRNIFVHLIKAASDPKSTPRNHWKAETAAFHADVPSWYTPGMRQLIRTQRLWDGALKVAAAQLEEHGANLSADIPRDCPFSLDDVLHEDFEFDAAVAKLRSRGSRSDR